VYKEYERGNKRNRSHTHTHRQRTTPPTHTHTTKTTPQTPKRTLKGERVNPKATTRSRTGRRGASIISHLNGWGEPGDDDAHAGRDMVHVAALGLCTRKHKRVNPKTNTRRRKGQAGCIYNNASVAPACAEAEPAHRRRLEANALILPGMGGWVLSLPLSLSPPPQTDCWRLASR